MNELPWQPKIILGVAAHADDIDCHAGGSVALWTKGGAQVYYLVLTDGSLGANDPALPADQLLAQRQAEQRAAAKILGVSDVFFAGFADGSLANTDQVRRTIVSRIRELKPDTVLGWDPDLIYSSSYGFINHADHRAAGSAALDAVYPLARNPRSFTDLTGPDGQALKPHRVNHVLLMTMSSSPDYVIDIAPTADTKLRAMQAHLSQMDPHLEAVVEGWSTKIGHAAGLTTAESFNGFTLQI
jgi:LmbE family N-acetylglucosaminyl deacetylase